MDHETDPIYRLAASTAGSIGNDFLAALVRDLHGVMPVRLAMVTQSLGDPPTRVRALYSWKDGVLGAPVEYDLEGTPCQLVYRGQTVIIPEELAVRFPKEQGIWNSYCGVPLRNRAQVVVGHFAVISDGIITHLQRVEGMVKIFGRRVEAELQRIADDEERDSLIQRLGQQHSAARQKSQFMSKVLGMVAHDLRNPLASVVSRTELIQALIVKLQGGSDQIRFDGKLSESTDAILRSASRMETMIHDLIDAARRETTEISLNVAEFPLSRAVASAIQLHEEYAGRKALRIEADLDEQLRISADEDRLIEAVGNLLSNAIKYSSRDALIRVSCRAAAEAMTWRSLLQMRGRV